MSTLWQVKVAGAHSWRCDSRLGARSIARMFAKDDKTKRIEILRDGKLYEVTQEGEPTP